jgi:hypothetical protein
VIPAVEALKLEGAQLTDEQKMAADKLEAAIDTHVRANMRINGVDYATEEKDPMVIAEVNQRLKRAGWLPQWEMRLERHRLNAAAPPTLIGFGLHLAPSDDAFAEALRATLS